MQDLESYIFDVKLQLTCNASNEYKTGYITYDYSNQEIDDNLEYFKECMDKGLSAYKALLLFKQK
jgi:hypothetical protein